MKDESPRKHTGSRPAPYIPSVSSARYPEFRILDYVRHAQGQSELVGKVSLLRGSWTEGSKLQLTDGGPFEAGSAFYANTVTIDQPFSTDFTFHLGRPDSSAPLSNIADGFTFAIVEAEPDVVPAGTAALGGNGGALGFTGIAPLAGSTNFDMAIKFDLFSNDGEGSDSTGLYVNGALPTVPAVDLTGSGINLHSGHDFHAHLAYDGSANLALTLTDMKTQATWSHTFPVNIPKTIGGVFAHIGFTGGTGALTAKQDILSWTFTGAATPQ